MTEGPFARLVRVPARFRFGAAVRLLWIASGRRDAGEAIGFSAPVSLAHPVAEVDAAAPGRLSTRLIGLIGASGPLPRWYTELVAQANRARSPAMADFLALLAQRLVAGFAVAGVKYRPHLAAEIGHRTVMRHNGAADDPAASDPAGRILLALTGFDTRHLIGRLAAGAPAIQHYAGFFASRPRSADRLRALVSDWLERKVEIEEFAGSWLRLDPDEQSRMPRGRSPGQFNRLGVDCAAGARAFDQQARFLLRIGPLSRSEFEALLPDKPVLRRLVSMVRAYVGMEADFAVNLILDPAEIPVMKLGGASAPRLSWTGWLPSPASALTGPPRADQATFSAATIESARTA
ncbi:type VI secretion system baseplate subunit TssG [Acidiphilium sp. AL]|uniref:Type VI secretion system baseplate subunit TssG n=1 Tax=Acidiphilium iwatense TaxID=768198 RepID=A0ABS9DXZ6_9PROT|nr:MULTISPECIES: type VI secretion system baseplate subunit TssG [Acidiphilium]MCF3947610.1 type VI secretion system baseplate subunit TssG [Acidiphilium iwatense]MCU4160776.1 type VI secretion system baseplate subunit TssG [Acidiphilium sp. AL]